MRKDTLLLKVRVTRLNEVREKDGTLDLEEETLAEFEIPFDYQDNTLIQLTPEGVKFVKAQLAKSHILAIHDGWRFTDHHRNVLCLMVKGAKGFYLR